MTFARRLVSRLEEAPTRSAGLARPRSAGLIRLGRLTAALLRWLPGLAVVAGSWAACVGTGAAGSDVARYLGYCIGWVLLPGLVVNRQLRRFDGRSADAPTDDAPTDDLTWVEALGYAWVTGLVLELVAAAAYTSAGVPDLLWTWPSWLAVAVAGTALVRRRGPLWRRVASGRPALRRLAGRAYEPVAWLPYRLVYVVPYRPAETVSRWGGSLRRLAGRTYEPVAWLPYRLVYVVPYRPADTVSQWRGWRFVRRLAGRAYEPVAWLPYRLVHLVPYRRAVTAGSWRRRWPVRPVPSPLYRLGLALLVAAAASRLVVETFLRSSVPPTSDSLYVDVPWHLALAAELRRAVPPEVPQEAGSAMHYHWFVHGHLAAGSLVSGVDLPVILLRLWLLPCVAAALVITTHLGRRLTGRPWAGLVAAAVGLLGTTVALRPTGAPEFGWAITPGSPSEVFALLPLLACTASLLDVFTGRRLGRGGWALLAGQALLLGGSKSSGLPLLVAGCVLTCLVTAAARRPLRRALTATAVMLVALVASVALVTGVTPGSGLNPMQLAVHSAAYQQLYPGATGWRLAPGALAVLLASAAAQLPRFAWVIATPRPRRGGLTLALARAAAGPALLVGAVCAGVGAALLLDHPGFSQAYFYLGAIPFCGLLSAVALDRVVPRQSRRRATTAALCTGGFAGAVVYLATSTDRLPVRWDRPLADQLHPWIAASLLTAALLAGWHLLRWRRPAVRGWGRAVGLAGLLASSLAAAPVGVSRIPHSPAHDGVVRIEEQRAARWLAEAADRNDVVATNVHCSPPPNVAGCNRRAFWVSGLTEHRTVVEGWAYLDDTLARDGEGGQRFDRQPYGRPGRLRDNDAGFTAPTREGLRRLHDRYGVRWLFADSRYGPVSARLAVLARERHRQGPVTVYELPD